jgi:predicted amidophosphoribosyltransferase
MRAAKEFDNRMASRLKKWLVDLNFLLKSCVICESSSFKKGQFNGLFCPHCEEIFIEECCFLPSADYKFPTSSILVWTKSNHRFVQRLLISLKGENSKNAWEMMAKEALPFLIGVDPKTVVVPAPPRQNGRPDHAYFFAFAISRLSGLRFEPTLTIEGEAKKQSMLRRSERSSRKMLAKHRSFQRVVFVDDIITTGSTAEAARVALNYPKFFNVLAFACRPASKLV